MNQRNSYYNNFRRPEAIAATEAQIAAAEANPCGFDKVFDLDDQVKDSYKNCAMKQKKRDDNKQVQAAVLTSAQALGWREPYDNVVGGNNRTGMCTRTFHDTGHM